MAITNSQQARQMYEYGGLSAPRQNYGLGKLVKKAFRGVKKVAKSPLGKAALMYAGTAGLGSLAGGGGMSSLFKLGTYNPTSFMGAGGHFRNIGGYLGGMKDNFMSGKTGKMGSLSQLFRKQEGENKGKFSMGKLALGGLGVASLAPLLMKGDEDEIVDEAVEQINPATQVARAKNFYSGMGDKGVGLNFMPQKKYVSQNFYAADGGRAGYAMGGSLDEDEEDYVRSAAGQSRRQPTAFLKMGGGAGEAQAEQMLMAEFIKYKNQGGDLSFEQFVQAVMQQEQSQGMEQPTMMAANGGMAGMSVPGYGTPAGTNQFGYPSGGERVNAAEGGIMDTEEASEMIDMGGNEKDYRDEGGFVAMGGEERADDVPARLSKNEFVFTADAVRNAGGGDIDRGSEVMQNLMDNLEQGGQVSEESQGMGGGEEMMSEEMIEEPDGAQAMYEQQQALQSRMI